jgi:uncharacterized protein YjbI with pentapeptide repeats
MAADPRAPKRPRVAASLDATARLVLEEDAEWQGVDATGDFGATRAADVEIAESRLAQALFTGSALDRIRLTDCLFEGCDLSGALIDEAVLTRVEFHECRMSGFVASRAKLRDVRFVACRLEEASFRMAAGERIEFVGCDLRGSDFYEARMADARFASCDLSGAELSKAELRGARLQGSKLDDIKGSRSLEGVVIDSSQIVSVALGIMHALDILIDDEDETGDEPDEG